jgi:outer membrane protein OmpA-like peptidoglycan-associated protein
MKTIMKNSSRIIIPKNSRLAKAAIGAAFASTFVLTGCASLPPHPELEALQTRYEIMSGQTRTGREAFSELAETREALELGREAYRDDDDDELAHYIVVADKNLDIVEARIELDETREQIASASLVREGILRQASERDAVQAERDARLAEADARAAEREAARADIVLDAQQEELADREAELRAQERELDRKDAELEATEAELAAANREAQELADALEEVSMVVNERGTVLVLSDIMFDFDSAVIKPGSEHALDEIAEFLISQNESELKVEGHTDSLGTDQYNDVLSRDRAAAVRTALVARGVPRDRIEMAGYGEDFPVASNESATGRQLNRRVEIVLDDRVGRPVSSRF